MVREYKPSDLDAIARLFARSVHEVASRDHSPAQLSAWAPRPPDLEAWARRLGSGGVFVFEREGPMGGFARIDETGCLDLLYVDPEVQRQGVARALFDQVLLWATSRGIRHLHADVSITARTFFESVGFRFVREQIVERRGVSFHNFRMQRDVGAERPVGAAAP